MIGSVIETAFPKSDEVPPNAAGDVVTVATNVSYGILNGTNATVDSVLPVVGVTSGPTGLEAAADVIELAAAVSIISGFLMVRLWHVFIFVSWSNSSFVCHVSYAVSNIFNKKCYSSLTFLGFFFVFGKVFWVKHIRLSVRPPVSI